ncbi:MAG: baseplate J/gp47 family protein, partial [Anaerolineae bacterium]|nr:baseplate J/gp47 family protein [Anaerolineae bacterium]
ADRAITQPDFAARLIPARTVTVDVEGTGEIATSGRRNAPADRAKGKVIFINRRAQEIVVPPGTVVGTSTGDTIRFRTTVTATLPAAVGSTAEAEVEALDPGPRGNVRAFTINNVEGPVSLLVRVVNEQPAAGGNLSEVAVVAQADKDRLREATERQLQQAAYARLADALQAGEFVPPETVGTVVLAETFDRFAGEVAPVLRVKLRVRARGLAVDGDSARTIAQRALAALVPPEGRLLAEGLKIQPGPVTSASEDRAQFTMNASGFIVRQIDTGLVRQMLYGLAMGDAGSVLQGHIALQEPPQISVGPDWYVEQYGLMPLLPWRIRVYVRYADAAP